MAAPAITAKTISVARQGAARWRSNPTGPGSPSDTTPDIFVFVPQTGVALGATITSEAVAITGINAPASVSVADGTWSKNGGAFSADPGTVVENDTVQVQHDASGSNSTSVQTSLTVGGVVTAVFTSTTAASPGRVGIIGRWTFATFSADKFNLNGANSTPSEWPVSASATPDGCAIRHLAETDYGASSAVRALPHFEIVSSDPTPPNGGRCAKLTIYPAGHSPAVNYTTGGFQSTNKPRADLNMTAWANANGPLTCRTTYWMGLAVWLPADYEEESASGWREILVQIHTKDGKNSWSLVIDGKGGANASEWACRFNRSTPGSTTISVDTHKFVTDVTAGHKGVWNYHVFKFSIDNRSSGGSPIFQWWLNETQVVNNTTTPYGVDDTAFPDGWYPSLNCYKPGWQGANGTYTGGKTSPIVIALSDYRIGSVSSDYTSVHPTQQATP